MAHPTSHCQRLPSPILIIFLYPLYSGLLKGAKDKRKEVLINTDQIMPLKIKCYNSPSFIIRGVIYSPRLPVFCEIADGVAIIYEHI